MRGSAGKALPCNAVGEPCPTAASAVRSVGLVPSKEPGLLPHRHGRSALPRVNRCGLDADVSVATGGTFLGVTGRLADRHRITSDTGPWMDREKRSHSEVPRGLMPPLDRCCSRLFMARVLEDRDRMLVGRENSVSPPPAALVVECRPELRAVRSRRRCQAWDGLSRCRQIACGLEYSLECRACRHSALPFRRRPSPGTLGLRARRMEHCLPIHLARQPSVPMAFGGKTSKVDGRFARLNAERMYGTPMLAPVPRAPGRDLREYQHRRRTWTGRHSRPRGPAATSGWFRRRSLLLRWTSGVTGLLQEPH